MCVFLYILQQKDKQIKGTLLKMLVSDTLLAGIPGMSRNKFFLPEDSRKSCNSRSIPGQESRLVTGIPYEQFEQCKHMREMFKVIGTAVTSLSLNPYF
jgi:hypothetical protein